MPHRVQAEMWHRVYNGMPQGSHQKTGEKDRAEVHEGPLWKEDLQEPR